MSVRAFTPLDTPTPSPGTRLQLDTEESHYLLKVRRVRLGGHFELLDGNGGAWQATLCDASGKRVEIEIGAACAITPKAPERIVLLGLPDTAATLEALTGASELGASEVLLVRCERSQGRLPSPTRIHRVLRAAMRQCGRRRALRVTPAPDADTADTDATAGPLGLEAALAYRSELPGVFGHTHATVGAARPTSGTGLRLLVGPEGGLTPSELQLARAAEFTAVMLGPWILRTPTAVTALLARFTALP